MRNKFHRFSILQCIIYLSTSSQTDRKTWSLKKIKFWIVSFMESSISKVWTTSLFLKCFPLPIDVLYFSNTYGERFAIVPALDVVHPIHGLTVLHKSSDPINCVCGDSYYFPWEQTICSHSNKLMKLYNHDNLQIIYVVMKYKKTKQNTLPCEFFNSACFYSTIIGPKYHKNQCNTILSYMYMCQELTERHCNTVQQYINTSQLQYTHSNIMKLLAIIKVSLIFFLHWRYQLTIRKAVFYNE